MRRLLTDRDSSRPQLIDPVFFLSIPGWLFETLRQSQHCMPAAYRSVHEAPARRVRFEFHRRVTYNDGELAHGREYALLPRAGPALPLAGSGGAGGAV